MRALVALAVLAALLAAPPAPGQQQKDDLSQLWGEYPLDQSQDGLQRPQIRERDGSISGPPPKGPSPGGPIALAILYLALALGVLGVAGAVRRFPGLQLWRKPPSGHAP